MPRHRVLQVHPSRRCNLRCLHCYSASGPEVRDRLKFDLLRGAIGDAAAEGYTVVGFSGGEPLLYDRLPDALEHARSCGMATTVTSNGMLLDARRCALLKGRTDLLAISLDGVPASHDALRASGRAFAVMARTLETVRRAGLPFGFIFTLTFGNLHELDWVAGFALDQGAKLLQIHPLEEVGRARERLSGHRPDAIEANAAYVEFARLQDAIGDRILLQLDFAHRGLIRAEPRRVFAGEEDEPDGTAPLAELVSPLVVETDGTVVPLQHGFPRRFALGNLHEAPLAELARRWRAGTYAAFRAHAARVFAAATADREAPPLFNWYEMARRHSEACPA